jgi:hypothetical protein
MEKDPAASGKKTYCPLDQSRRFKVGASILYYRPQDACGALPIRISLRLAAGCCPALRRRGSTPLPQGFEGHVMHQRIFNEKGEKRSQDQWMRLHEATVALVAETADGTTVHLRDCAAIKRAAALPLVCLYVGG